MSDEEHSTPLEQEIYEAVTRGWSSPNFPRDTVRCITGEVLEAVVERFKQPPDKPQESYCVPRPSVFWSNVPDDLRREWWRWEYAGRALAGYAAGNPSGAKESRVKFAREDADALVAEMERGREGPAEVVATIGMGLLMEAQNRAVAAEDLAANRLTQLEEWTELGLRWRTEKEALEARVAELETAPLAPTGIVAAHVRIAELEAALKETTDGEEARGWPRVPATAVGGLRSAIKLAGELPPDAPTDAGWTVGRATSTINVLRGRIERTANRLRAQAAALAAGKE
jgi:hypothetical protein